MKNKDVSAMDGGVATSSVDPVNHEEDVSPEAVVIQDEGLDILLDDIDFAGIDLLPPTPQKRKSPAGGDEPPEFSSPPVKLLRNTRNVKTYGNSGNADDASQCAEMQLTPVSTNNQYWHPCRLNNNFE